MEVNDKKVAKTDNMFRTYEWDVKKLLRPLPEGRLTCYPVSKAINKVANGDPQLLAPVELAGRSAPKANEGQLDLL